MSKYKRNKQYILNIDNETFCKIVNNFFTKKEVHNFFDIPINGSYCKLINNKFKQSGAKLKNKKLKYKLIQKSCPVCSKKFKTLLNHNREKITCSYSCSNTYFRSGENNPNWSNTNYRSTCFLYHRKECIICKERNIVAVHHYDENKKNNDPSNLLPLCPTHHQYIHSRYKYLIKECVNDYITKWNKNKLI